MCFPFMNRTCCVRIRIIKLRHWYERFCVLIKFRCAPLVSKLMVLVLSLTALETYLFSHGHKSLRTIAMWYCSMATYFTLTVIWPGVVNAFIRQKFYIESCRPAALHLQIARYNRFAKLDRYRMHHAWRFLVAFLVFFKLFTQYDDSQAIDFHWPNSFRAVICWILFSTS